MAESVIQICNLALSRIGDEQITSLNDGSKAASKCSLFWPSVRDAVLRAHPWNCAIAQKELAALSDAPLFKWDAQYPLPSDFLRVHHIFNSSGTEVTSYEIQGQNILCDEDSPIYLGYVYRLTDVVKYDSLLTMTLVARLAAEICVDLTGSERSAQACWTLYENILTEARGVDAKEGMEEIVETSTWKQAKLGSGTRG